MARTVNFEGRKISVPDDATDDEVAAILDAQAEAPTPAPAAASTAGEATAPAAPPQRGPLEKGARLIDQAAQGIAGGAMNLVGFPMDVLNAAPLALNLLPGEQGMKPFSEKPIGGSRFLNEALDSADAATNKALGLDYQPKPENALERGVNRTGEELGAIALPAGAALRKGQAIGVPLAREAVEAADSFLKRFAAKEVESAAVNPIKYGLRNATAGVAAGGGASIANEMTGNIDSEKGTYAPGWADFFGALGGVGTAAVAEGSTRAVTDIVKAITKDPNFADQIVKERVTDTLLNAAGVSGKEGAAPDAQELIDLIQGNRRVDNTIPGYAESLGDRTQNAGIASLEYGRMSGENAGLFKQRTDQNTEAVDNALNKMEPQAQPGAFRSELELERDRRLMDGRVTAQNATDDAQKAVGPLVPQSTPAARGNTLRTTLEDARDTARGKTEEAYQAANVAGKQVDPTPLADALKKQMSELTEVERGLVPEGVISRVIKLGAAEEGPSVAAHMDVPSQAPDPAAASVTLAEATTLRSELGRLKAAALADPRAEKGGRNAARVLDSLSQRVDDFINSNLDDGELAAVNAARDTKFQEAEAFTRQGDPVAAALSRYEGGQPRMRDERVASTFADPQNMDKLFAVADTPQARAAIREEVLSRAKLDTPEQIQQFTQEYGQQIGKFPGLQDELNKALKARTTEAAAKGAESELIRSLGDGVNTPGRGEVAKYLTYADEKADRAMANVIASKDPKAAIDELLSFVNDDPKAVEGARKTFWNIMQSKGRSGGNTTAGVGGAQPWLPVSLKRFMDDPSTRAVAERLYRDNPEHLKAINEITEALQGVDLRKNMKAPNTSGTAQAMSQLLTPETLQSRFYAWQTGKIKASFLITSIGSVMARRAVRGAQAGAMKRMLDEALLNPDAAAMLLKENNPANRAALARSAKAWYGDQASTVLDIVTPKNEDDELKEAVQR